jgi:predicted metal-dependent peptidase
MSTATVLLSEDEIEVLDRRWEKAIDDLEQVMPLWQHHAIRLKRVPTRGWCDTAAVDGVNLFWNPEFVAKLNDKQLRFLLVHEVFHVAQKHITRWGKYLQGVAEEKIPETVDRLNKAADYAIHQILVPLMRRAQYKPWLRFIRCGLYDKRFWNMSMEEIYEFLLAHPDDPANGKKQRLDIHIIRGTGDVPSGAVSDADGNWVLVVGDNGIPIAPPADPDDPNAFPVPADPDALNRDIKRDVAIIRSHKAGNGSKTEIREAQATPVRVKSCWEIIEESMMTSGQADYSFARPNRQYLSRGLIVPGLFSRRTTMVIVIDTSGSIKMSDYNIFCAHVEEIRNRLSDYKIVLIFCSNHIVGTQIIEPSTTIDWKVAKGGGTSFLPPFRWVEENMAGEMPSLMLYFTDGEGTCPPSPPEYPVNWLLWGPKSRQPWGNNIPLEVVA